MGSTTGTRQVVVQTTQDSLTHRLMVAGEATTISTVSVALWDPDGTVISISETPTKSGAVATLTLTFDASTFPVGEGYKILWTLNTTQKRLVFFDVVLRRFESQLTDSDITDVHKGITLPTGVTSWVAWRLRAWRRIETLVRKALRASPHLVFYPEDFFDAHLALTLAEFFRPNAFDAQGEDWLKFREFQREGQALLLAQLADLDWDSDGDGLKDSADLGHDVRPWLEREFS